jgi:hypothetical protein
VKNKENILKFFEMSKILKHSQMKLAVPLYKLRHITLMGSLLALVTIEWDTYRKYSIQTAAPVEKNGSPFYDIF